MGLFDSKFLGNVPPVTGYSAYFMINTANVIGGGYLQLTPTASVGVIQTISAAAVIDGQLLAVFATNVGVPNITFIPAGVITNNITAQKTAGTKDAQLYFEFYKRTSGGVETLLATSTNSSLILGASALYSADAPLPNPAALLASDLFVTKVYAKITGGGSAPDIDISVEGVTGSRTSVPANIL